MSIFLRVVSRLCLLALLLSLSCKGAGDGGGKGFQALPHKVDASRLGLEINLGQVVLKAPKGWTGEDSVAQAEARAVAPASGQLVMVSFKPETRSLMAGWILLRGSAPAEDFESVAAKTAEAFKAAHPSATRSEARLQVNGIPFVQLMATDSSSVHFRLLISAQPFVVVDYQIPQSALASDLRSVESSIGSLRGKG